VRIQESNIVTSCSFARPATCLRVHRRAPLREPMTPILYLALDPALRLESTITRASGLRRISACSSVLPGQSRRRH